ncbi:hypothetical protein C5B96_00215 [Subtercola sp. Z020]|uniref:hypothetical protein n=1 Tax=Subtercola sp. Z020 TaxID=2080582 RepID=UPI000CE90B3A|nr:hypothetical protein [Subtercola sp. Z020]PPF90132.1 hypothetical protein C5B96_00215 [Subtercola sp. Z020]
MLDDVLAAIYRGRPATVDEMGTLTHLSVLETRATVHDLRARGMLGGEGDDLTYVNPSVWVAGFISQRSAELRRDSLRALSQMDETVDDLPEMLRHWSVGEATTETLPMVRRHGRYASEDVWYEMARQGTGTLNGVLPDVDRFSLSEPDRAERFGRALAAKDAVRVIIPTGAADDALVQARMDYYRRSGVQFRLLDSPASWFWVDGDFLGVPFAWGEGLPTGALGVQSAALGAMALSYFESLWQRADPAEDVDTVWSPLLTLMRQGVTLDTASRRLGINPRTGRRRVAAAMEHYGVSTLFALGVAWSADPQAPARRAEAGRAEN